ncbi:MAG TPA: hypothetical protein VK629_07125 [Steroidobacteraceae bacterium]|nr:hypothetical protein [Steroidobacteraceae bacterium]
MINYRTYPAIIATTTFVACFGAAGVLMQLFPNICWLPRIGGILVGASVFVQGYMHANADKFRGAWRWGLTREQAYAHFSYYLALFGTLLWAFGDLFPTVLWLSNGACGACS